MLDKRDAQWWIVEVQKHPESAQDLIRMLADRLAFLDKQNEELRGEVITLRRKQHNNGGVDVEGLQQRIHELEAALRDGGSDQRLLIYAYNRIEVNASLNLAQKDGISRELPADIAMLICTTTARLLAVTADSRVFNVAYGELPTPTDKALPLGTPDRIAAILDQSVLEQSRFLTLLSQRGYVYSQITGTVNQIARKQEKLLRNLIPDDPIMAAIPSHNADLFAITQKGRWTRFPEKAIAGVGSPVMELPKGDSVVGITPLISDTDLIFVTTDGKAFVRPSALLAARRAPGSSGGVLFKGQSLLGVTTSSRLAILTRRGKVMILHAKDLPYKAQTDTGATIPGLFPGDTVLAFIAL